MSDCSSCGGTGWIATQEPDGERFARCPCRLRPRNDDKVRLRLQAAGFAPDEIESAFRPWDPGVMSPEVARALGELQACQWDGVNQWLLCGAPGVGKTAAAARTAAEWIRQGRGSLAWVSCSTDLNRAMAERWDRTPHTVTLENSWEVAGLLVLDDLGSEEGRENRLHILDALAVHRHRHHLPTIYTTNGEPRDVLDGRLWSRIQGVIKIEGPDWRKERLA